jgi:hypothetical protein
MDGYTRWMEYKDDGENAFKLIWRQLLYNNSVNYVCRRLMDQFKLW